MIENTILSYDGHKINFATSYAQYGNHWLVFVIPFGLKLEVVKPFFSFFSNHYNILAWETRLILGDSEKVYKSEEFSLENHVKDLLVLVENCGIKRSTLIGYCSGAGVALGAINRAPNLFEKLFLVHGEYTLLKDSACTTPFATDIDNLLSMASRGKKYANLVFDKVNDQRFEENTNIPKGVDLPFTKFKYFRRHATNYSVYKTCDFENLARVVGHRTFVMTGELDAQANVNSSQKIANCIRNSEIYIDSQADHYGIIREDSDTLVAIWNQLYLESMCANY